MAKYTDEFKQEAVRLYLETGEPQMRIAQRLGITCATLRSWIKKDEEGKTNLALGERDELRALRKENAILQEENEILKKAAAFFVKENLPKR